MRFPPGLLAAFLALELSAVMDAEGGIRTNLAALRELPEGTGLAAGHPGDVGIAAAPGVLFADDFESGPLGGGWDEVRNPEGEVLGWEDPGDPALGRRCLRVEARLDRNTGGGLTRWFEPGARVFIRFHTRFASEGDYVHHFVTLRANRGLRGGDRWSGFGGAGVKPDGTERFSTAIEPWGDSGRWPAPGRWNFYSYWYEMDASPDGRHWGNSFAVTEAPLIPRDRWIAVEFMLAHNTPGEADGEQAFWIDGKLQGHWKGIRWRKVPELRANALTLETYVTDRWTRHPVNVVCFDNVVVADRYIGPSVPSH
ncbi:MAG: hypothetical protein KF791_14730 [Verrucomicrobiae bacterium]|nr:hypothetical protein [Verrucomicrobiae bacterium]